MHLSTCAMSRAQHEEALLRRYSSKFAAQRSRISASRRHLSRSLLQLTVVLRPHSCLSLHQKSTMTCWDSSEIQPYTDSYMMRHKYSCTTGGSAGQKS